jgi:hypothetical protein
MVEVSQVRSLFAPPDLSPVSGDSFYKLNILNEAGVKGRYDNPGFGILRGLFLVEYLLLGFAVYIIKYSCFW